LYKSTHSFVFDSTGLLSIHNLTLGLRNCLELENKQQE